MHKIVCYLFNCTSHTLLLSVAIVLTACIPDQNSIGKDGQEKRRVHPGVPTYDDDLVEMARQIPGFGGMFTDTQGDFNVYLSGPAMVEGRNFPDVAKEKITAALIKVFGEDLSKRIQLLPTGVALNASPAIKFLEGQYSMIELARWYPDVQAVFRIDGVTATDIDEGSNRIKIGIEEESIRTQVQATLAENGVPPEMVTIVIRPAHQPVARLGDTIRPTQAGTMINYDDIDPITGAPDVRICSLGLNVGVYDTDTLGFLTNSHCTTEMGTVSGDDYYQNYFSPDGYVGKEVLDPTFWTSLAWWECPWGRRCRYSDAALVEYTPTTNVGLGLIARPALVNDDSYDQKLIDAANPTLNVSNVRIADIGQGMLIHKIGSTTGWTYGRIREVCLNIPLQDSNVTLKCQTVVERLDDTYSIVDGGDSGAPAFFYTIGSDGSDWAHIVGLVASAQIVAGSGVSFGYSDMLYIIEELGVSMRFWR
jgi:hypothetical protein